MATRKRKNTRRSYKKKRTKSKRIRVRGLRVRGEQRGEKIIGWLREKQ